MRLLVSKHGPDLFVEAEWQDQDGHHSKRITEALPVSHRTAVAALMTWADEVYEATLASEMDKYTKLQEIDREISRLTDRRRELALELAR